jgi:MFS family permease
MSAPSLTVPSLAEPSLVRARYAVSTLFFVGGFATASWVPHIPTVQLRLQLSASMLGMALPAVAAGAVVAMPLTGGLIARWGTRAVTHVSALLSCLLVALPVHAPSFPWLVASLGLLGVAGGVQNVALNAHAVTVERRMGRTIMSSFHGLYSLGGLVGAGASLLLLSSGLTPSRHMVGAAVVGLAAVLVASRQLLPASEDEAGPTHLFVVPRGLLLVLGGVTSLVLMVEGAMADWTAVYLRQSLGTAPELGGAGYAVFSMAMAAGRLSGDRLVTGFGPERLVRAGGVLAACGLGGALLLHHPVAAVIGFGCVGLGVSNLIPVLLSAAGRMTGTSPGVGIAAVSTAGFSGFLVGPPLVGFLTDQLGLPLALGGLAIALSLVAASGALVRPAPHP